MDYFKLLDGHIEEKTEIMGRLCNLEGFWIEFLHRFKDEDDTFKRLQSAVADGDPELIMDYLHMFKGVVLNLGLSKLSELTANLLRVTRLGSFDPHLFASLEREYDAVISKLSLAEETRQTDAHFAFL